MTDRSDRGRVLARTIDACIDNGQRLIDECYYLEFRDPPFSQLYLILIAQEEFAKAFIVFLIKEGIVPLSAPVRRAINDHCCKQLIGVVLDYLIMHWENVDELNAAIQADMDRVGLLPNDVGSAVEILRYEKIGRWDGESWAWSEDPNYDPHVMKIAQGKKDRRKQDALYVRIGSDGQVAPTVPVSKAEIWDELQRAGRYGSFVHALHQGEKQSDRLDRTLSALRGLFADRSA